MTVMTRWITTITTMPAHSTNASPMAGRTWRIGRAFTLVELLISIAILFLLIGVAAVALQGVRKGANRADSMQALRQMITGYLAYAQDHNGRLMPGYIDPTRIPVPNGNASGMIDIHGRNPLDSASYLQPEDITGYVWRLTPYLGGKWQTMFKDYRSSELLAKLESELNQGKFGPGTASPPDFGIGTRPAYGLNSIFLGGDSYHGGSTLTDYNPWYPGTGKKTHAAVRLSEVKNQARMIVFAPTIDYQEASTPGSLQTTLQTNLKPGYVELRAPYGHVDRDTGSVSNPQWMIDTNQASPTYGEAIPVTGGTDFISGGGLPYDRQGEHKILCAHLDGSVDVMLDSAMTPDPNASGAGLISAQQYIMSFWSPFVSSSH
jgi:type II secretory pathway pseudopilin PulG